MESVPRQLAQAIETFNQGFYFECHDILEALWLEAPSAEKSFYQGLLHVAVGFYHLESLNYKGCISQLGKAEERLHSFGSYYRGVALKDLLKETRHIKALAEKELADNNSLPQFPAFPKMKWNAKEFENTEKELK